MRFPEDGDYVFPGGLAPLEVRGRVGTHVEPNVWLRHASTAGARRRPVRDVHEPVGLERGDDLRVERRRLASRAATSRSVRARALPERALEARLLAQRLVAAAARRARCGERAARRSAGLARGTRCRRDPSAPGRPPARSDGRCAPAIRCTFVSAGRTASPKANAADRSGGVRPDAGQLGQVVRPTVARRRRGAARCRLSRAPVVAEPLPLADHVGGRGCGERLERRPALEPGQVPRHDPAHLRLLQHHLRDEDRVRVARLPPRQVRARSS